MDHGLRGGDRERRRFLGFEHQAVTHLTGTTTMFAAALAGLDRKGSLHFAAVVCAFLVGAVMSGVIIQNSTLQLGRHYGVALILEAMLLAAAVPLLVHQSAWGMYAASCACGLQNAMVSTYSGAVIRTTHLSGMFTDLGIFLGHFLRGIPVDRLRLRLCLLIITGFLCGSAVGAVAFRAFGYRALYLPSGMAASVAVAYAVYRHAKGE